MTTYETKEIWNQLCQMDFFEEFQNLYPGTVKNSDELDQYLSEIMEFTTPRGNKAYEINDMVLSVIDMSEVDFREIFNNLYEMLDLYHVNNIRNEMKKEEIPEKIIEKIISEEMYNCAECGAFMEFFEDILECQNCYEKIELNEVE